MFQKPNRFISDLSNIDLSHRINNPYLEQRNPSTINNHSLKTNFIAKRGALLPKGPRAIAVTESGDKFPIQLNKSTSTHHFSSPSLQKNLEQSSLHVLVSGTEKSIRNLLNNESSSKLTKKLKNVRQNIFPKHRLTVKRPYIEKSSSTRVLVEKNTPKFKPLSIQSETQANYYVLSLPSSSRTLRKYRSTTSKCTIPLLITQSKKHLSDPILNDRIEESPTHIQNKCLVQSSAIQIYTKTNGNLKKYSELRGFAFVLTFIVILWLLSKIFDLESLSGYFSIFLEHFQNWYSAKEKPKTKTELLVKFLQDLWS